MVLTRCAKEQALKIFYGWAKKRTRSRKADRLRTDDIQRMGRMERRDKFQSILFSRVILKIDPIGSVRQRDVMGSQNDIRKVPKGTRELQPGYREKRVLD